MAEHTKLLKNFFTQEFCIMKKHYKAYVLDGWSKRTSNELMDAKIAKRSGILWKIIFLT